MIAEWFNSILAVFKTIRFNDVLDILVVAVIVFSLFRLVRETRAEQLLKGVIILLAVYIVSMLLGLTMMIGLMRLLFEFFVLIVAIVFQPEIRKALERLGKTGFWKYFNFIKNGKNSEEAEAINKAIIATADTATLFSSSKTGALIVFEREVKLSDIASTGTIINSDPSVTLLGNIFFNKAPLHDGATIIRDGRVFAAGCILPLTDRNKEIDINLGTRHRAAIGMSEVSDAVVVVVSEETGAISVAVNGIIKRDYDRETLASFLQGMLLDDTKIYVKKTSKFSSKRKENKDETE